VQHQEKRWFRVRASIIYDIQHFVQAANRDEAREVYWGIDITDIGEAVDEIFLEIEECEDPVK
jgi:hypothetical protein